MAQCTEMSWKSSSTMANTFKDSFLHMAFLQWRPHSFNCHGNAHVHYRLFFPVTGGISIPGTMVFLRKLSCPTLLSFSMIGPSYQSNEWDSQHQNSSSFSSNFDSDFQWKERKATSYDRKYSTSYSVLTMGTVKRTEEDHISSVFL